MACSASCRARSGCAGSDLHVKVRQIAGDLRIVGIRAEGLELQVERVRYVVPRPVGAPRFLVPAPRIKGSKVARHEGYIVDHARRGRRGGHYHDPDRDDRRSRRSTARARPVHAIAPKCAGRCFQVSTTPGHGRRRHRGSRRAMRGSAVARRLRAERTGAAPRRSLPHRAASVRQSDQRWAAPAARSALRGRGDDSTIGSPRDDRRGDADDSRRDEFGSIRHRRRSARRLDDGRSLRRRHRGDRRRGHCIGGGRSGCDLFRHRRRGGDVLLRHALR